MEVRKRKGPRIKSLVLFRSIAIDLSELLEGRASLPGIEPGLRPSQGRVRIRHTPRTSAARWM